MSPSKTDTIPVLLILLACGGNGVGAVETLEGAPWTMPSLPHGYWVTSPYTDDWVGSATLLLSDTPLSCRMLTAIGTEPALQQALESANGFIFGLDFYNYNAGYGLDTAESEGEGAPPPADRWTGLWMGGGSYAMDKTDGRHLMALAFHRGTTYPVGDYGSAAWLRVDDMSNGAPAGAYNAVWWLGTYEAEDCGDWETGQSGYDSGR